jgi:MFS transporter, AAHS family, 3-hydroxyphenylpropionic acid transporter
MVDGRISRSLAVTVSLCLLGAICEGFDVQAAGVAAAGLSAELHPAPGTLGLFFAASGAGLMIGALIGGRLSDYFGRKAVLVASIGAFGCFSLVTSVMPDIPLLTGARFLTGLGLGGAMPNLIALAADSSELRVRNASIAAAYAGMPLGAAAASLIVFAVPLESWRVVFRVGGVAPLIIATLMLLYLPATPVSATRSVSGPRNPTHVVRELFGKGQTFRTLLLWLCFFLIVLTLHLMLNWLPLLLVGKGLQKGQAALAQAGFNLGGAFIVIWFGVLLDSAWRRAAIVVSVAALPAILALMAISSARPQLVAGLAFLLGGAILAEQLIAYAVASACYPIAARGTGVGAAVAAGRLGSLAGPLFAGWLLAAGGNSTQVLIGVLPVVVLCGICVAFLGWRELPPR